MTRTLRTAASIAIVVVSTTACTASQDALERTERVSQQVVNGRIGEDADVLATVAIMYHGEQGCTGTLVTEQLVITAAHCLRDNPDDPNSADIAPETLSVVAGMVDVRDATPGAHHAVAEVHSHEGYPAFISETPEGLGRDDDIGVVVLQEPILDTTPVPILPAEMVDVALAAGKMLWVSGYGITDLSPDATSGVLYTGETPYLKRSAHEVLAGGDGHADACYGDSGGPLYVEHGGAMFVVGATSRGPLTASAECGESGIYTLVSAYDDWLQEKASEAAPPPESDPDPIEPEDPSSEDDEEDAPVEDVERPMATVAGGCSASGSDTGMDREWLVLMLALLGARARSNRRRRQLPARRARPSERSSKSPMRTCEATVRAGDSKGSRCAWR